MAQQVKISSDIKLLDFLKEAWEYKNLVLVFAWRDLRVRYAQTFIGLAWAVFQPLVTLAVLWLVFGRFLNIDTGSIPKISFIASGVSIWTYFSFVALQSSQAIIQAQQMIKKIYFPKIILPISKAVLGLVDLLIINVLLLVVLVFSGVELSSKLFLWPFIIASLVSFSLGLGIWISALSIKYRDLQHVFPFLIQLGIYITPVAYPASFAQNILPDWALNFFFLNPVAGLIELLRFSLFDGYELTSYWYVSIFSGLAIFISGVYYFKFTQKKIADLI